MKGFTLRTDEKDSVKWKENEFTKLWKSLNCNLGISIQDTRDWSFNRDNIVDVQSCGGTYQRHFQDDQNQQEVLDKLYQYLL